MGMTAKQCEHDLREETGMGGKRTSCQGTVLDSSLERELIEFELIWLSEEVISGSIHVTSVGLVLYLKNNRQMESNTHPLWRDQVTSQEELGNLTRRLEVRRAVFRKSRRVNVCIYLYSLKYIYW